MIPKKIAVVLWGILAFFPLFAFIIIGQVFAGSVDFRDFTDHPEKMLAGMGIAVVWANAVCYAVVALFLVQLFVRKDVTRAFKTKWAALLLLLSIFAVIVYWYRHIVKQGRAKPGKE